MPDFRVYATPAQAEPTELILSAKNQHPNLDPSLGLTLRVAQKSVSRQKV